MSKILVVDDDPNVREMVVEVIDSLCGGNHQIDQASDGDEALGLFREKKHELVVSDFNMPKMNGDQLAVAVRAINPQQPFIVITGKKKRTRNHFARPELPIFCPNRSRSRRWPPSSRKRWVKKARLLSVSV